jgi:hypothetical protein
MTTIGALLTRYAFNNLAQALGMHNGHSSSSESAASPNSSESEAFKIELGKHSNKRLVQAATYHPTVQAMRARANAAQKSSAQVDNTPQSEPVGKAAQTTEQLDFQEFEQISFKAFKAAWGTKDGEANFNAAYDFDNNGIIDMLDYLEFGKALQASFKEFKQAWGSAATEATYDSHYDYNKDGIIDMLDWLAFGKNWVA